VILKPGVLVVQDHRKWRRSIRHCWPKYSLISCSCTVLSYLTVNNYRYLIQTGTIRNLVCGFLFDFHSNYGSILHHFRHEAYWSKIVIFHTSIAFDAPVTEGVGSVGILTSRLVRKKTRTVWLRDGEKTLMIIFSRFIRIPTCDRRTDGQTDGQTSCHGIVRAVHTHHAVKHLQSRSLCVHVKERSSLT